MQLAIDRFALTANNVSYAVAGDTLGYWRFFPADPGWGLVPVWGFAGYSDSKWADMQAGIESALSIVWAALSGANLVNAVSVSDVTVEESDSRPGKFSQPVDPIAASPSGRVIRLKAAEVADVYDILSVGSQVVIRR